MCPLLDQSIPLYYQVENILRERINEGEYAQGKAFPTELQLADEFKVSRITIRQALSALTRDKLIIRRRGKRTIVKELPEEEKPTRLSGFIEDILAIGIKSSVKLLAFDFVKAPKSVMDALKLEPNQNPLRIEKIRFIGKNSFSHVVNYVPPWIGQNIDRKNIKKTPLLEILEKDLQIQISYGSQIITAVVAGPKLADALNIMVGGPLFKIERTVYDVNHSPIEYVVVHYRGDRYSYSVSLKRLHSSPKGTGRWEAKGS